MKHRKSCEERGTLFERENMHDVEEALLIKSYQKAHHALFEFNSLRKQFDSLRELI